MQTKGIGGGNMDAASLEKVNRLKEIVAASDRIVFFGGAGVSTESGIPDFRSVDGLYNQQYRYPPEVMVSHSFFVQHTEEFYEFYRNKMLFPDARPNAAHLKLAELERAGKVQAVITQNIDGLHYAAGSKNVMELHGSVHRNYCMECGKAYPLDAIVHSEGIPRCDCGGVIKPDVVLYEESLDYDTMQRSVQAIRDAEVLIIGGTSLAVYPAAGFIDYFHGKHLIVINMDPTSKEVHADLVIRERIGEVFSAIEVSN